MKELKKREELIFGPDFDWDDYKSVWVKALFTFDPKDVDIVRKSSVRTSFAKTLLALNNTEYEVEIGDYEVGFELEPIREYDIRFKRPDKETYNLRVFGTELKLI